MEQCAKIVRRRARFHAAWWDDARLGTTVGNVPDANAVANLLQTLAERLARFSDRVGDGLSPERRAFYERLLAAAPRLLSRRSSHSNQTIMQGDAHVWNCFLPRDGSDDIRFFDWDSWRIGAGSDDLAYMMAIHWYPDLRRRFERPLLDHYHAALIAQGVNGYDRNTLDDDYRLSVRWRPNLLGLLLELAVTGRHADSHSAAPQALRRFPTLTAGSIVKGAPINTMPVATIYDRKHPIYSASPRAPL
jgi:hypothetical protein